MSYRIVNCQPDSHARAVQAIFNDAIANTTALYDYSPRSLDTVVRWFGDKARRGDPVIGAVDEAGELLGFASYGPFRNWAAYKYTVEHSVYVHRDHRRRGVARALLQALLERAQERQLHVLVGGIDVDNAASIALHRSLGFEHAGTLRQAGYKFGRWLDLAFYQRLLPTPLQPVEG